MIEFVCLNPNNPHEFFSEKKEPACKCGAKTISKIEKQYLENIFQKEISTIKFERLNFARKLLKENMKLTDVQLHLRIANLHKKIYWAQKKINELEQSKIIKAKLKGQK